MNIEKLKYPIGKFELPKEIIIKHIENAIMDLENLPKKLKDVVNKIPKNVIDTPYRENGWTYRQLLHHIADSHINFFVRLKLALTEENPTIKPYNQNKFAELPDSLKTPIELSINIIEGLHGRMVFLLKSLNPNDFKKTYYHPESKKIYSVEEITMLYAWHSNHHLTQLEFGVK